MKQTNGVAEPQSLYKMSVAGHLINMFWCSDAQMKYFSQIKAVLIYINHLFAKQEQRLLKPI